MIIHVQTTLNHLLTHFIEQLEGFYTRDPKVNFPFFPLPIFCIKCRCMDGYHLDEFPR